MTVKPNCSIGKNPRKCQKSTFQTCRWTGSWCFGGNRGFAERLVLTPFRGWGQLTPSFCKTTDFLDSIFSHLFHKRICFEKMQGWSAAICGVVSYRPECWENVLNVVKIRTGRVHAFCPTANSKWWQLNSSNCVNSPEAFTTICHLFWTEILWFAHHHLNLAHFESYHVVWGWDQSTPIFCKTLTFRMAIFLYLFQKSFCSEKL